MYLQSAGKFTLFVNIKLIFLWLGHIVYDQNDQNCYRR